MTRHKRRTAAITTLLMTLLLTVLPCGARARHQRVIFRQGEFYFMTDQLPDTELYNQ